MHFRRNTRSASGSRNLPNSGPIPGFESRSRTDGIALRTGLGRRYCDLAQRLYIKSLPRQSAAALTKLRQVFEKTSKALKILRFPS